MEQVTDREFVRGIFRTEKYREIAATLGRRDSCELKFGL